VSSTPQNGAPAQNPTYESLGGEPTISALVERFYHHMDTLPEAATIRAMHAPDLAEVKRVLTRYLCEWTGGPNHYSSERGHPRLRMRHAPFAIGAAERDAWMACMRAAMSDVIPDAHARAALEQAFYKLADFMRNNGR
jgi:hemoglobin